MQNWDLALYHLVMLIQPNRPIPPSLLYNPPPQRNLICARNGRLILSEGFKKKKKYTTCSQVQIFWGTPPKRNNQNNQKVKKVPKTWYSILEPFQIQGRERCKVENIWIFSNFQKGPIPRLAAGQQPCCCCCSWDRATKSAPRDTSPRALSWVHLSLPLLFSFAPFPTPQRYQRDLARPRLRCSCWGQDQSPEWS